MAKEFDIDNIIPRVDQPENNGKSYNLEPIDSMKSFNLSIKNYDIESNRTYTQQRDEINGARVPDIAPCLVIDDESGLITSDSDFDHAEKTAGYMMGLNSTHPHQSSAQIDFSNGEFRPAGVRKDVSKTFKKLLTSNNNR